LVFDGDCGFCRYWLVKWKKLSVDHYNYQPFQAVAEQFKDIPLIDFKRAVHLIFPDGRVLKGAAVAFFPYFQFGSVKFLYRWYRDHKVFRSLSDKAYRIVARNRPLFFKLSKAFFGKDPYKKASKTFIIRLLLLLLISLAAFYLASICLR